MGTYMEFSRSRIRISVIPCKPCPIDEGRHRHGSLNISSFSCSLAWLPAGSPVGYMQIGLFQLLGGRNAMIESPVLQELKAEWTREDKRRTIVDFLVERFGPEAEEIKPSSRPLPTTRG